MLYSILKFILTPFVRVLYRVRVEGYENLPKNESYILCANHASAIDPLLVGSAFPKRIYCMAKAELFERKMVGWFLKNIGAFPVKRGEADIGSIKTSLKLLKNGKIMGIFPEGTRSKDDKVKAEPGLAMLAIKAKVPIVPMAIVSDYKMFHKSKVIIGEKILLKEYFDTKLQSDEYTSISNDIMRKIKSIVKGD